MTKIFNILIAIILLILSAAFVLFAIQNNADVNLMVFPEISFTCKVYTLVLSCFAFGFISALIYSRFEYIKTKINLIKILKKFKSLKKKSRYVED
ncbi:MAG: hypothetical protein GY793_01485 [Proteobacteria bacterium]|nr:hypothetical protein [Pseudomonadota bacterium]